VGGAPLRLECGIVPRRNSLIMRAVIHAGLHKTGTSSFQRCCYDLRDELIQQHIHYPYFRGRPNHNHLVNQSSVRWVAKAVNAARKTVGDQGCLLISAENLEYDLHTNKPARIEKALAQAGISEVIWVLCFREPFAAYRSLYAQLSNSGRKLKTARAILEFGATGQLIASEGKLCLQNRRLSQTFHFNYPGLIQHLQRRLQGSIVGIDFKDFTQRAQAPGDLLIQAISKQGKGLSELRDDLPTHTNTSATAEEIERRFVHRFFAVDPRQGDVPPAWINTVVQARLEQRLKSERSIKRLFKKKLADWDQAITPADALLRQLRPSGV